MLTLIKALTSLKFLHTLSKPEQHNQRIRPRRLIHQDLVSYTTYSIYILLCQVLRENIIFTLS